MYCIEENRFIPKDEQDEYELIICELCDWQDECQYNNIALREND